MTQISRKRRFGAVASLAAAYALVLHVMLSSLMLALVSPAAQAAGLELCLSHPDLAATTDDTGKSAAPVGHCPACIAAHAPAGPPPSTSFAIVRIAQATAPLAAADQRSIADAVRFDHRARAPPQLN